VAGPGALSPTREELAVASVPDAKVGPQPRLRARVKLRPKAQLTLPEEIRRVLHISEVPDTDV
jgi:hypothetical protein